jgi:hypothetical protein
LAQYQQLLKQMVDMNSGSMHIAVVEAIKARS